MVSLKQINMKKITTILLLIILCFTNNQIVNAKENLIKEEKNLKDTIENFVNYLNKKSNKIYNYVDTSNKKLYSNISSYVIAEKDEEVLEDDIETDFATLEYNIDIKYEIKNITQEKDISIINTIITGKGTTKGSNWNIKNVDVYFKVKKVDNQYKIIDTNLFENVGSKNVFSHALKGILKLGFICIGIGLLFVIIVIIRNRRGKIR